MKDNSGLKTCQERVNYLCGIEYLLWFDTQF